MFSFRQSLIAALGLLHLAPAAPTAADKAIRGLLYDHQPAVIPSLGRRDLDNALDDVLAAALNGTVINGSEAVLALLEAVGLTLEDQIQARPTSIQQFFSRLVDIVSSPADTILGTVVQFIQAGIPLDSVLTLFTSTIDPRNSETNINPAPLNTIYPKKSSEDAPYSLTENQLREVIYIPPTFTYGKKPPVILLPATGSTGWQSYNNNYIPLLTGVSYADPVWLNIPGQLLDDVQTNSEYVAYAINYISSITSQNVSLLSWSQGGLNAQWAFKYWPSTRQSTIQLVALAPDLHGTLLAAILCVGVPGVSCNPAAMQQMYNSNLITTFRSNDGDTAFIPTTTINTATDEIVQPQAPLTNSSGYLIPNQKCSIPVTNVNIQDVCGGLGAAGTIYLHEGILYNPLAYALVVDALKNKRPASVSDIDLDTVCAQLVSPGLTLDNILGTEEVVLSDVISALLYTPRIALEPALKTYATGKVVPAC